MRAHAKRKLDDARTEHTVTWTDPGRPACDVRCVAIEYADFPTVEWTLYFENTGSATRRSSADPAGLDTRLRARRQGRVHPAPQYRAAPAHRTTIEPLETPLRPKAEQAHRSRGRARSTQCDCRTSTSAWAGEGVIVVVGWPGQWAAEFARDDAPACACRPARRLTHFKLQPGEEIRTPLDRRCSSGSGRLDPRAERLAALDDRAQPAPARRQAPAAAARRAAARTSSAR